MADKNQFPTITGIIHSIPVKEVTAKKGQYKGQTFNIPSIVVEFSYNGSDRSQLIEFRVSKRISSELDNFATGDSVQVTYAAESKPWNDKYITEIRAIAMKHTDKEWNDTVDLTPKFSKEKPPIEVKPLTPEEEMLDSQLPF